MASQVETLVASAPIKSSAEKFYNFFKHSVCDVVKIFPAVYTGAEILEGEEGAVGCVQLWSYIIGGVAMSAKVKIESIDDASKSIAYVITEGDLLQLYKSFKVTIKIDDGLSEVTILFEKATPITPPPQIYVPVIATACTLVDAHILNN